MIYIVSAAPKDALQPYTWHFPIVGRVPYKGIFQKAYAREEEQKLGGKGYDTYTRVRAFSTLGYFNDPILSCMLTYTDSTLDQYHRPRVTASDHLDQGHVASMKVWRILSGSTAPWPTWRSAMVQHLLRCNPIGICCAVGVFEASCMPLSSACKPCISKLISRAEKLHRREQLFAEAKDAYPSIFPDMKTP